jgi:hypothetical protein
VAKDGLTENMGNEGSMTKDMTFGNFKCEEKLSKDTFI